MSEKITPKDRTAGVGWDGENVFIGISDDNRNDIQAQLTREEAMRLGHEILDKAINETDPGINHPHLTSQSKDQDISSMKTDNANLTEELYLARKSIKKLVEQLCEEKTKNSWFNSSINKLKSFFVIKK